jgi:hypothetical protein
MSSHTYINPLPHMVSTFLKNTDLQDKDLVKTWDKGVMTALSIPQSLSYLFLQEQQQQ